MMSCVEMRAWWKRRGKMQKKMSTGLEMPARRHWRVDSERTKVSDRARTHPSQFQLDLTIEIHNVIIIPEQVH